MIELGCGTELEPSALSCDNLGTINLTENPRISDRSKHIDIAYHFIRELVENGTITILHVPGEVNSADIYTKVLPGLQYEFLKLLIGISSASTD